MPCGVQTRTSTLTLGASARKWGVCTTASEERMFHTKRNVHTLSSVRNLILLYFCPDSAGVCSFKAIVGGNLEQARIRLPTYDVLKCLSGLSPRAYRFDIDRKVQ